MRSGYCDTTTSPEIERVVFRFLINGTSNPDSLRPGFQGVTDVARTGAGLFTVTFENKYPVFIGMTGSVIGASVGMTVEPVGVPETAYTASAGTLAIRTVVQDGSPAAGDPTDNDWVFCECYFARRNNMHAAVAI